jgi:hypothetical protein
MNAEQALDFTVEQLEDGTWEVWTPDFCGACIGSGGTKREAMEDALQALRKTAECITAATDNLVIQL